MGINLSKGEGINLAKDDGSALRYVRMGLGWDAKTVETKGLFGRSKSTKKAIDLDASAALCSGGRVVEYVSFTNLRSSNGSVVSSGDNLTGEGEGDDESISVDLVAVDDSVDTIVFAVTSYGGEPFDGIDNAYVRVLDVLDGEAELVRYTLTGSGAHTAMVMAKVERAAGGWRFTALGNPASGRTVKKIEQEILSVL